MFRALLRLPWLGAGVGGKGARLARGHEPLIQRCVLGDEGDRHPVVHLRETKVLPFRRIRYEERRFWQGPRSSLGLLRAQIRDKGYKAAKLPEVFGA